MFTIDDDNDDDCQFAYSALRKKRLSTALRVAVHCEEECHQC